MNNGYSYDYNTMQIVKIYFANNNLAYDFLFNYLYVLNYYGDFIFVYFLFYLNN